MKIASTSSNASWGALHKAARRAWDAMDYALFFKLMGQVIELAPDDPMLLLELGFAYGRRTDFPPAIDCFERAIRAARDKGRVLLLAADRALAFSRFDLGEQYLERAAREPGVAADTLGKLAEMKERARQTEAAEAAVEQALKLDSRCQMALLTRARLGRLRGELEAAEKDVRSILARTDRENASTRVRGWYELAAILDRQGRYDEAMKALIAAKKMVLPAAARFISWRHTALHHFRTAGAELTTADFQRWREADTNPSDRRLAVIAGHPRSGTTLLEQLLDAHSGIVSAEETDFFFEMFSRLAHGGPQEVIPMLDALPNAAMREARQDYFRRLDSFIGVPTQSLLVIDKNPSLTALLPNVLRVLPETKLIVALRDPRDVCLSCFMQFLHLTPVTCMYLSLDTLVEEYTTVMGYWKAIRLLLPRPALEVRYEDVVNDVRGEAERTLRFLDLAWEPAVLDFAERSSTKLVRSPTYAEVARPISRGAIGRWRHYRDYLEPYLEKLAPLVEAFGYEAD